MSKPASECDRCSRSFDEAPTFMNFGAAAPSAERGFRLCPHCSQSLSRWFRRGGRSHRRLPEGKAAEEGRQRQRRQDSHERRKRSRDEGVPAGRMLALYVLLVLVTLAVVYVFVNGAIRRPLE